MKLDHFVPLAAALEAARSAVLAMPSTPTIDVAKEVARDAVKRIAYNAMKDYIRADIQEIYEQQVLLKGEPDPDPVQKWRTFQWDDWEEGQDEALDAYFDGLPRELMSSNFLGTIGNTALRKSSDVEVICNKFFEEAWRNLTHHHNKDDDDTFGKEKTAAQILSSVGVTIPFLEDVIAAHVPTAAPEPPKKEVTMYDKNVLLQEIRDGIAMLGIENDPKQIKNALESAVDDDDNLAASGFMALGVDLEDDKRLTMQTMNMTFGVDGIYNAIKSSGEFSEEQLAATEPPAETVAGPELTTAAPPEAPKRGRKAKTASADDAVMPGKIPVFVLQTLRDKTGMKAEDVALKLGTARTTFLNYCQGRQALYVNDGTRKVINDLLDEQIKVLTAAREQMNLI